MGSEFIVTLPRLLAEPRARRFASAPSRTRMERRERVLVVDDNHDAANLFKLLLEDGGHEVSVAYEPLEALALVQRLKPTVMLVDIGLPVMDGYELATRVREAVTDSTPRLIALTGYGRDIDRSRTRDAGFEDHLVKPVASIDLLAAVAGRAPARSGVPRA